MRNGKLNKNEVRILTRAWEIADQLAEQLSEAGQGDGQEDRDESEALAYAREVSEAISWLMGALRG